MEVDGCEPVDVNKKKLLEEVLVEKLDDAIIKVAKMRKRQPPKIRSVARNIAHYKVQYYGMVCVQAKQLNTQEPLEFSNYLKQSTSPSGCQQGPHSLNELSKDITDCVSETNSLNKMLNRHMAVAKQTSARLKMKRRNRFLNINKSHLRSSDFVIQEAI